MNTSLRRGVPKRCKLIENNIRWKNIQQKVFLSDLTQKWAQAQLKESMIEC